MGLVYCGHLPPYGDHDLLLLLYLPCLGGLLLRDLHLGGGLLVQDLLGAGLL